MLTKFYTWTKIYWKPDPTEYGLSFNLSKT